MKIRTDYVTNSSSSSFVIEYKNDNDLKTAIDNEIDEKYAATVYNDIKNHVSNIDIFKKEYRDYFWYDAMNCVRSKLVKEKGISMYDFFDYEAEHTEEVNEMIEKEIDILLEKVVDEMDKNSIISVVEYDDHSNGELEHDIMPQFSKTIKRISHH